MGNLVIVSNRLPVAIKKVDGELVFSRSIGGLATGLGAYAKRGHNRWIGWPGIASDDLTEDEKERIFKELAKQNYYPVFLSQAQLDGFYNGYSNSILWPLFHDVPVSKRAHAAEAGYWRAYQEVNALFTKAALALSNDHDQFWVHDYQLMLLPTLIRIARPTSTIGFFLHIPVPLAIDFKKLRHGEEICAALLGADLLGLQTVSYVKNFLEVVQEYGIGITSTDGVVLDGRSVKITNFPIGVDYGKYVRSRNAPAVAKELLKLRAKYLGKQVIVSVDRQDPAKGILERLQAYHTFLVENPSYRRKVVYIALVVPSRTEVKEYQNLKQKLDEAVLKTNETFGTKRWRPIEFIYDGWEFEKLTALYRRADVAFVTPRRDGMNLVAKEYLASRPARDAGVLILSETAGAAAELKDAILVDPSKPKSLVKGLLRALTLPEGEKQSRTRTMQRHLQKFTVQSWADGFIQRLEQPVPKLQRTRALNLTQKQKLIADYHLSEQRLFLLDYDGTLSHFFEDPEDSKPTKKVMTILKRLGSNPANEVIIVSGRSRRNLEEWFGNLPITLAAEHGAVFRPKGEDEWHVTSKTSNHWRSKVEDVFDYYAELTPGAFVEQKEWALVWHYRAAKPYAAQKNLVAIRRLLQPIAKKYGLRVKNGHKVVEVHSDDISKGKTAQRWLLENHDFVFCAGDDVTDEDMFKVVPPEAYSIKVGSGQSSAQYRVDQVDTMVDLLSKL